MTRTGACRFRYAEPRQRKTLAYRRSHFSEPDGFVALPVRGTAKKHRTIPVLFAGDPYGTRTHVTTVKGWCLNRLTNGPYVILFSRHHHVKGWFSDKARWPLSSVTLNATYRISLNSPLKNIINIFLNGQLGLTA